ncbi:MAG: hypothetical protein PHD92_06470, partial [Eubacteriales bacterium]|nr:hypothetical protein [Eubacteriales bacterium]MDD4078198.1 hypothetical protein [Eubacteriales bacterium]
LKPEFPAHLCGPSAFYPGLGFALQASGLTVSSFLCRYMSRMFQVYVKKRRIMATNAEFII